MNDPNTKSHVDNVCEIFEQRKDVFMKKNQDYGCSYIKSGEIMNYILDGKQPILKTAEDHMAYQLIIRKLDKLLRFCNLRFTEHKDQVGEKIVDTISDDGVYSFMLAEIEENIMIKNNFNEKL